jgi:DNA repair protein RadC
VATNGANPVPDSSDGVRYDASPRIKDMALADRPRERLYHYGPASLNNPELLAILLGGGVPGDNVVRVAEGLLARFGGLDGVRRATFSELQEQRGIAEVKAGRIQAAFVLGQRLLALQPEARPVVSSPADIFNLLGAELTLLDHEELRVILLDARNRIQKVEQLYKGSVNSAQVRVAEVFKPAIRDNAPAILLVHNHPSGDPMPSEPDVHVTRQVFDAGKLLDIALLDHIIVGSGGFYSMKEHAAGFP